MKKRIFTHEEKCTGCNKCISVCPVDCANQVYRAFDGRRKVMVDSEYCISCGACITVCDHQARDYLDDTDRFFQDLALAPKEPVTVVAAPAAQVHFPELGRLFGWLKFLGVRSIYDVSVGADIATWAYLRAREELSMPSAVAQPCSSIVNYCERYLPELLPSLVPIQSPLMCLAFYLRRYGNLRGRIAFLSPCIAKAEEIEDPHTGHLVQYNVTFSKLKKKMEAEGVDLSLYPSLDFDGMPAGIGHVYSRPGGLGETVRVTEKGLWIRQVEAVDRAYPYLREYLERKHCGAMVPALVDVLNCEGGCNFGTGTDRDVSVDDIDRMTDEKKRKKEEEQVKSTDTGIDYAPQTYFDKHLHWRDFERRYADRKLKEGLFADEDLEVVYKFMHKKTPESRNINCHACGYGSCKRFAQALKLGMNVPESCIDYERSQLKMDMLTTLLNHGGLGEAMELFLRWYRTEPYDLALIMMDVDDFKTVNDRFGHDVGDIALQTVAEAILNHTRPTDASGRWGGDEFMIILPHTSEEQAKSVAIRIQKAVLSSHVLPDGEVFSSSAGVAMAKDGDSAVDFFQRADRALYEAKKYKRKR